MTHIAERAPNQVTSVHPRSFLTKYVKYPAKANPITPPARNHGIRCIALAVGFFSAYHAPELHFEELSLDRLRHNRKLKDIGRG